MKILEEEAGRGAGRFPEDAGKLPSAGPDTASDGISEKAEVWAKIAERQGEVFYTAKGLPFVYTVRGGELFADRRGRSVTRSTFERAYEKIVSDGSVTGPKKLNMYGAPYVFAILKALGVLPGSACGEGKKEPEKEGTEGSGDIVDKKGDPVL